MTSTLPIHKLTKFSVIYKPWQSGKTFEMFEIVNEVKDPSCLHVIFTDNYIIQGDQLNYRFDNEERFQHITPVLLNSKVPSTPRSRNADLQTCGARTYMDVQQIMSNTNRNVVITPTNLTKTRNVSAYLSDIVAVRRALRRSTPFVKVFVWIDEIDKNVKFFKTEMLKLNSMSIVDKIYGLTATGLEQLFAAFGESQINLSRPSPVLEEYVGFHKHEFQITELTKTDTDSPDCEYLTEVVKSDPTITRPGSKVFAPALPYITNHEQLRDTAFDLGFDVVVVVNGRQKAAAGQDVDAWVESRTSVLPLPLDDTQGVLDAAIAKMAHEHDWVSKSVLVTGHYCITRGITIQYKPREEFPYPPFLFTHAMVPLLSSVKKVRSEKSQLAQLKDWADFSQMAARVNGNYGGIRDAPVKYYTNHHGQQIMLGLENINMRIAFEYPQINKDDYYNMVENEIMRKVHSRTSVNKVPELKYRIFNTADEARQFNKKLGHVCYIRKPGDDGFIITGLGQSGMKVRSLMDVITNISHAQHRESTGTVHYRTVIPCYEDVNDVASLKFVVPIRPDDVHRIDGL